MIDATSQMHFAVVMKHLEAIEHAIIDLFGGVVALRGDVAELSRKVEHAMEIELVEGKAVEPFPGGAA